MNRKYNMIKNDPTKHYPGKPEAKVLRRIMSQTGLTEKEVRDIKKYRQELAYARNKDHNHKYNYWNYKKRIFKRMLKRITKELKLAKEHPKTIERLIEMNKEHNKGIWIWHKR